MLPTHSAILSPPRILCVRGKVNGSRREDSRGAMINRSHHSQRMKPQRGRNNSAQTFLIFYHERALDLFPFSP